MGLGLPAVLVACACLLYYSFLCKPKSLAAAAAAKEDPAFKVPLEGEMKGGAAPLPLPSHTDTLLDVVYPGSIALRLPKAPSEAIDANAALPKIPMI